MAQFCLHIRTLLPVCNALWILNFHTYYNAYLSDEKSTINDNMFQKWEIQNYKIAVMIGQTWKEQLLVKVLCVESYVNFRQLGFVMVQVALRQISNYTYCKLSEIQLTSKVYTERVQVSMSHKQPNKDNVIECYI